MVSSEIQTDPVPIGLETFEVIPDNFLVDSNLGNHVLEMPPNTLKPLQPSWRPPAYVDWAMTNLYKTVMAGQPIEESFK